jgi:hypothetical protein
MDDAWLLVQRKNSDLLVSGEPYHALQLLFNLESGGYLVRILGKTFARGSLKGNVEEAAEVLVTAVFHQTAVCR